MPRVGEKTSGIYFIVWQRQPQVIKKKPTKHLQNHQRNGRDLQGNISTAFCSRLNSALASGLFKTGIFYAELFSYLSLYSLLSDIFWNYTQLHSCKHSDFYLSNARGSYKKIQRKLKNSRKSICQPRLPENEKNKSFMQSTEEIIMVGESEIQLQVFQRRNNPLWEWKVYQTLSIPVPRESSFLWSASSNILTLQ